MTVLDPALTLIWNFTITTPAIGWHMYNLYTGTDQLLLKGTIIPGTTLTTSSGQIQFAISNTASGYHSYIHGYGNSNYTVRQGTNQDEVPKCYSGSASNRAGDPSINFEYWLPNRTPVSGFPGALYNASSGPMNGDDSQYMFGWGSSSANQTYNANDIGLYFKDSSNSYVNMQAGSNVQIYSLKQS